jgi:hypothetical protein
MGPIWRYRLAVFSWPIIGLTTASILDLSPWAIIVCFVEMLVLGGYSISIRCPECGKPVGELVSGWGWNAFASSRCGKCGHDLSVKL